VNGLKGLNFNELQNKTEPNGNAVGNFGGFLSCRNLGIYIGCGEQRIITAAHEMMKCYGYVCAPSSTP